MCECVYSCLCIWVWICMEARSQSQIFWLFQRTYVCIPWILPRLKFTPDSAALVNFHFLGIYNQVYALTWLYIWTKRYRTLIINDSVKWTLIVMLWESGLWNSWFGGLWVPSIGIKRTFCMAYTFAYFLRHCCTHSPDVLLGLGEWDIFPKQNTRKLHLPLAGFPALSPDCFCL